MKLSTTEALWLREEGDEVFRVLQRLSWARSLKWEGEPKDGKTPWTTLEFMGAIAGELGEAANVAKKMRRHTSGMVGNVGADMNYETLREKFGLELADVLVYILNVAEKENINLFICLQTVFNRKSEQFDFEEMI